MGWFLRSRADAGNGDRSIWGNFWFSANPGARVVTADTARGLTTVYSCVKVLAESFAVMPFKLYGEAKGNAERGPRIRQHWLVRLFTKAPNRFQSPFEWRMMLMGHLALRGNAFCQVTPDGRGGIAELLPLHPDRMHAEMLPNGSYRYRYVTQDGGTVYYTRGEVWHLRTLSDDGVMGLSPITECREAIGEGQAMQSYSSRFFANDAKPGGGWIEVPGSFNTTDDKINFRNSWQQMQGGANRGKVAVLEKGMKFHELGLNNADAQFIESRAAKVADLCRIWRIPPHMVGDLSRATFSNIEQQSIEFWTNTMLPWAEMWESSIEFFLLGEESPLEPEFDMRRMLRGDSASRGAYYQTGIQSGWLTRNEARQMEGLDPLPDLDEPLVPLNMVSTDEVTDPDAAEGDDPATPLPADEEASARLAALVNGNAARMARRIASGSLPSPQMLAEALAVPERAAAAWLEVSRAGQSESDLHQGLRLLGIKGTRQV